MRVLFKLALILALTSACDEPGPMVCPTGLPDQEVFVGESTFVVSCFTAESLPLTYSATSTNSSVVSVQMSGHTLEIIGHRVGQTTVSITATDANGKSASQNVQVTVPNRAPEQVAGLPLAEIPLWNVIGLDLTDYFRDPDSEPLTFEASTDGLALKAELRGDTLGLYATERGRTLLEIVATDPHGAAHSASLSPSVGSPLAYITQGSHSRHSDVPMIAGKPGLLRVFLATDSFAVAMPAVTARLQGLDGEVLRRFDLSAPGLTQVPRAVNEGSLDRSLNAKIEPHHLLAAARLVVEIEKTNDPAVPRRIDMQLPEVAELPPLQLTLLPIVFGDDERAAGTVADIVREAETHPLLHHTVTVMPVVDLEVHGHAPLYLKPLEEWSNQFELIEGVMAALTTAWELEGRRGIYLGIIPERIAGGIGGVANISGPRVGFSVPSSNIIAHELGHVFGLLHAPCVAGFPDPDFPTKDGSIDVWGYDFSSGTILRPDFPKTFDIMGYCRPVWLSNYHLGRAIQHLRNTGASSPAVGRVQPVLAVQGRIDADGNAVLRPAFYTEGTPTSIAGDSHEITAWGLGGELFSYLFTPHEIVDGPGGASFFHLVPVTWGDAELTTITLAMTNGGTARLDTDTDQPYSVVIRADGQVESVGFGPPPSRVSAGARVLFSRGIPRR